MAVYNWIEAGQLDRGADSKAVRYGPRAPRPSKLDAYKGIIDTRLAGYPRLSAVRLFKGPRAGTSSPVRSFDRTPAYRSAPPCRIGGLG